jgi:hypothetical protein
VDNLGAVYLSREPIINHQTRHVGAHLCFVRQQQNDFKTVKVLHEKSAGQIADFLTKPVERAKLVKNQVLAGQEPRPVSQRQGGVLRQQKDVASASQCTITLPHTQGILRKSWCDAQATGMGQRPPKTQVSKGRPPAAGHTQVQDLTSEGGEQDLRMNTEATVIINDFLATVRTGVRTEEHAQGGKSVDAESDPDQTGRQRPNLTTSTSTKVKRSPDKLMAELFSCVCVRSCSCGK